MKYHYKLVEVFTEKLFDGAQIAVFPDADGLDKKDMQLIARELNLSETVFMFNEKKSNVTRKLRIFSPKAEIDFVGHPMIASGYVLGSDPEFETKEKFTNVVFQQNSGRYDVCINHESGQVDTIQFTMKPDAIVDPYVPNESQLATMLSIKESDIEKLKYHTLLVSSGQTYLVIPLRSFDAVRNSTFDQNAWAQSVAPICMANQILIFSTQSDNPSSTFHGRLVGPDIGFNEDPPIGSAMPAFTSYLCNHEQVQHGTHAFVIDRGHSKVRKSILNVEMDYKPDTALTIRIGGPAILVGEGTLNLP